MFPLLNRGGDDEGFRSGGDRQQTTLLPECLDDWVDESNAVRAVDVFVDALELREPGFGIQSSRPLEREAARNLELMWLTGRLVPDHKTIADFRKDNGPASRRSARNSLPCAAR
jgi:hypothetical protein